ncbi:MAG: iron-sulfur cluster repair di-iron protein [Paenibacillaceae bacterium]
MGNRFNGSNSIGEIVSNFPGASNLFKRNRIDFCCGGDRLLETVLRQQKLDETTFIDKLNQLYIEANKETDPHTNWLEVSNSDLIDHVVNTHHTYLVTELPLLSEFVTKILKVHGQNHGELSKLHRLFHMLKIEFEQHLIAEEQTVFPLIREYDVNPNPALKDQIAKTIMILEAEHSSVGELLKEIRTITDDYTLPPEACRTYTLTFQKLEGLESDTFQHIHLENNILFPRFL